MNNPEIVHTAQDGDWLAFQRLVIQHQDLAYTLAYYFLGNEQTAASALQLAFMRSYRELGSFHHGSFRGWLLQRVLAACRRQPAGSPKKPARVSAETTGDRDELQHRLLGLPLEWRTAIILVDLLGMDYEEAAQAAGCSPRAVSYHLARARAEIAGGS
jgi:RNA polymerase sigma-70 factor (ECF subfamily)